MQSATKNKDIIREILDVIQHVEKFYNEQKKEGYIKAFREIYKIDDHSYLHLTSAEGIIAYGLMRKLKIHEDSQNPITDSELTNIINKYKDDKSDHTKALNTLITDLLYYKNKEYKVENYNTKEEYKEFFPHNTSIPYCLNMITGTNPSEWFSFSSYGLFGGSALKNIFVQAATQVGDSIDGKCTTKTAKELCNLYYYAWNNYRLTGELMQSDALKSAQEEDVIDAVAPYIEAFKEATSTKFDLLKSIDPDITKETINQINALDYICCISQNKTMVETLNTVNYLNDVQVTNFKKQYGDLYQELNMIFQESLSNMTLKNVTTDKINLMPNFSTANIKCLKNLTNTIIAINVESDEIQKFHPAFQLGFDDLITMIKSHNKKSKDNQFEESKDSQWTTLSFSNKEYNKKNDEILFLQ